MNEGQFCDPDYYRHTRKEVLLAHTLPPSCYRNENFHLLEQEKLFGRAYACVGYSSQVKEVGQILSTSIAGQPIIVTRDQTGTLRAFHNTCRHRGSLLVENDTKLTRFRCPYHSWTYDLSGKLISCPLFDNHDPSFNKNDYGLLALKVESWGCFIFVSLDPLARPLSDYLGDLPQLYQNFPLDELILVRRKKYSIQANWKLIAENFLEYYHLPFVHPELCEVTAIDMHQRNQGAGMFMSFFAHPLLKGNSPLDADFLPAMPGLSTKEQNAGYFPFVFPNLATFLLPHHLFVLLMQPASLHESQEWGDLLMHPSSLAAPFAEEKIDAIFQFYDMVNLQDIKAVERVQKGLKAEAFRGGRFSYRFEEPVHRFQNMVIDYMTDDFHNYPADPR